MSGERELLGALAGALNVARTRELDDSDVGDAVAALLERTVEVLERELELTILAGHQGITVNGEAHAFPDDVPELTSELAKGMPQRGLAGIVLRGPIEEGALRALIVAWRLDPSSSPARSLERFRETLASEQSRRGIAAPGPIELVGLEEGAPVKLSIEDDTEVKIVDNADEASRAPLAELAQRPRSEVAVEAPRVPANRTLVKHSGDVIPEDLVGLVSDEEPAPSEWTAKVKPEKTGSSWVDKGDSGRARSWLDDAASSDEKKVKDDAADDYRESFERLSGAPPTSEAARPSKPEAKEPKPPARQGGTPAAPSPTEERTAPKEPTPPGVKPNADALAARELANRLGAALRARRFHEESDHELSTAASELLARATSLVEKGPVTLLAGPAGVFVKDMRFDLAKSHPDAAKELVEGAPPRGIAGFTFSGPLERGEILAILAAWKVDPRGNAKSCLARFREVLDGERQGQGLSDPAPIKVIPADGKTVPPANARDATAEADAAAALAIILKTPEKPPKAPEKPAPEKPAAAEKPARAEARPQAASSGRHAAQTPPKAAEKPAARKPTPAGPSPRPAPRPEPEAPKPGSGPVSLDTAVGNKVAGPSDERQLLARLGKAFLLRKSRDEGDRVLEEAVVDLLDRLNFALESGGGELTLLAGAPGLYVQNRHYGLPQAPDAAKELGEGAPQRMLAGFNFTGALDQSEVKALLTAWRVNPTGSPKASFARFREVWEGERQGFGLSDDPPIQLLQLFADGKLPVPSDAIEVPDEEEEEEEAAAADKDVEKKANETAVRPAAEVIHEDLQEKAKRPSLDRVGSSEESFSAEDLLDSADGSASGPPDDSGKTPLKTKRPVMAVEDLSKEAAAALTAYARLASRAARALAAPAAESDRMLAALRRAVVEVLKGLENTAFEDRLLALTAYPGAAGESRARHAANTAVFAALAGRSLGINRVPLADLAIVAALHDDGDIESATKPDRWPRTLQRTLEGSLVSDLTVLRSVVSYERTGARGAHARPVPNQKKPRLESRVVACACAFDDAITGTAERASARPDLALDRLAPGGHDPTAAKGLAAALGRYPRGTLVQLSNGTLAVVLACGGRRGDKPRVRIFADASGKPAPVREVELSQATDLSISKVEDPARLGVDPRAHLVAWG